MVNWNRRELLRACLASLRLQTAAEFEIIVVDNGSTDGSAEMAGSEFGARVIRNERNRGFCAANNQGIAAARGDFVALLNNDAEAEPAWLAALYSACARRPDVGMAAYRQGRSAEAESAWTAMAEQSTDPEVLADIILGCADARARCAKALARAVHVADAGDGRRVQRLNYALGSYQLRNRDYARAIAYMEAGRDKSNKNKIEANDPEMLAGLAEAYYRTKQFSEGLEIFFEMSQEFPAVRQIQEAVQGVYSMEQRSAGDVRIL